MLRIDLQQDDVRRVVVTDNRPAQHAVIPFEFDAVGSVVSVESSPYASR